MSQIIVHEVDVIKEGRWDFNTSEVRYSPNIDTSYHTLGPYDPFPGYAHQSDTLQRTVDLVQQRFAPLWDVHLFSMDREVAERTNGLSYFRESGHYEECSCGQDDCNGKKWIKDPPHGVIALSGKRIPPHPAMTRYLVGHEYGHHVEWMLNHINGADRADNEDLMAEYVKIRGLASENHHQGNGGTWHDSSTEVFACDFRILICQIEEEFWPHPGIPYPSWEQDLGRWWHEQFEKVDAYRNKELR